MTDEQRYRVAAGALTAAALVLAVYAVLLVVAGW